MTRLAIWFAAFFTTVGLYILAQYCHYKLWDRRVRRQARRVLDARDALDESMANYARLLDDLARDPIEPWQETGCMETDGPKFRPRFVQLEDFPEADQKILNEVMRAM